VNDRRIETRQSRTAEMICGLRAISSMESRPAFRSGDHVAQLLLPMRIHVLCAIPLLRRALTRIMGPAGMYEWIIARTRYVDAVFEQAVSARFAQAILVGAGFDTRAIRFFSGARGMHVYELDAATTQEAKLQQYRSRRIQVPPTDHFIPVDFEKESFPAKLKESGFRVGEKTLVIAEGVFQYLTPEVARETLRSISSLVSRGSWLVFDYAHASVLRGEGGEYGEEGMTGKLRKMGEAWKFGLDDREVAPLLAAHGFALVELKSPRTLEGMYFMGPKGKPLARINGTQSIVRAERT